MCALGEGRYIRSVVQSDGVAAILDASQRFGEIQFRDRLILLMFDPKTSEAVRVLGFNVPTNGFTNVTGFRAWLGDKTESFEDKIKVYQKR